MTERKPLYVNNYIDEIYFGSMGAWKYLQLIDFPPQLTIKILVAQWLERLTGHQKVAGSTPV